MYTLLTNLAFQAYDVASGLPDKWNFKRIIGAVHVLCMHLHQLKPH